MPFFLLYAQLLSASSATLARLVELFGASAAYAAVLVVFLANHLNSTGSNHS